MAGVHRSRTRGYMQRMARLYDLAMSGGGGDGGAGEAVGGGLGSMTMEDFVDGLDGKPLPWGKRALTREELLQALGIEPHGDAPAAAQEEVKEEVADSLGGADAAGGTGGVEVVAEELGGVAATESLGGADVAVCTEGAGGAEVEDPCAPLPGVQECQQQGTQQDTVHWMQVLADMKLLRPSAMSKYVGMPAVYIVEKLGGGVLDHIHHRKAREYIRGVFCRNRLIVQEQSDRAAARAERAERAAAAVEAAALAAATAALVPAGAIAQRQEEGEVQGGGGIGTITRGCRGGRRGGRRPRQDVEEEGGDDARHSGGGNNCALLGVCPVMTMGYASVQCTERVSKARMVEHLAGHVATLMKQMHEVQQEMMVIRNQGRDPVIGLDD